MDHKIADYISANRAQYTREAIIKQLEAAGHDRQAIDAAWDEVARAETAGGQGKNLGPYVWIVYWLGAGLIGIPTVIGFFTSTGLGAFGIGWLIAYLLLTYLPARALARARPTGTAGLVGIIVVAPLVVLLIGGGICLGTVWVVLAGLSG